KRLYLTWARFRRRFGGGQPEPCIRSRFLKEVPAQLTEKLYPERGRPQVNLFSEQHEGRETVKRNLYTGKTYNSIENIGQFFAERGLPVPKPSMTPQPAAQPAPAPKPSPGPSRPPAGPRRKPFSAGATIRHPKYGKGTVLRREGEGE